MVLSIVRAVVLMLCFTGSAALADDFSSDGQSAASSTCDVVCDCYLSGAEGYPIDQIKVTASAYCPADSSKLSSLYKFLVEKNYEECSRSWPRSAGSRRFGVCTKNF
ncbi:MAG: hypothetical protein JNJ49_00165 [Bdellovibrionaceae bacterium]|nr:hypothetical protein [Pseudobdellovibrionaceae bacterium]